MHERTDENYVKYKVQRNISTTLRRKAIDRFHSRDWWPQWGGETIQNI